MVVVLEGKHFDTLPLLSLFILMKTAKLNEKIAGLDFPKILRNDNVELISRPNVIFQTH